MSKVLLIENNDKLETIYTMNLVLYLGADYITVESFEEASEIIAKEPLISLIITKDIIPECNIAQLLKNYLDDVGKHDFPMIILGDQHEIENLRDNHHVIASPTNIRSLLKTSAQVLGISAADMAEFEMPTFYPVDINHFLAMEKTVCDVYVEVPNTKGQGFGNRYIKRIMKDYKYPQEVIQDYIQQGKQYLYILSEYRLEFINDMTNAFIDVMKSEMATLDKKMMATGKVLQVFNEHFNAEGFTEAAEKLVKESIKSIANIVSSSKNLKEMLANLLKNQNSFQYIHCQSTAFVADKVIDNMEWGSKEQKEKLNFIIFMHDALLQSDIEAKIATNEELDAANLDAAGVERVTTHASKIAEKLLQMESMPFGADTIIMQHHGARNGIGFNEDPPNNLSPLAIVFIICEEFIHAVLKEGPAKIDPEKIIEKIYFKHKKKDKYTKVAETLSKIKWGY